MTTVACGHPSPSYRWVVGFLTLRSYCWQVLGDPDRLRGILLNLYTNAAKFTKRGAIALRVSVTGPNYRRAERLSATHACRSSCRD